MTDSWRFLLLFSLTAAAAAAEVETVSTRKLKVRRSQECKWHSRYSQIPNTYRQQFENGDRFSAIVRLVNDTIHANSSSSSSSSSSWPGCDKDKLKRFPLLAFASAEAAAAAEQRLRFNGFEQSKRAVMSIANLMNYIYQMAEKPFEQWFAKIPGTNQDATFEGLWYSLVSSVVASNDQIFGCYAVLLGNDNKFNGSFMPHAYRSKHNRVMVDNYGQDVSPSSCSPGFEWVKYHYRNAGRLERQVMSRPSQTMTQKSDKNLLPFSSRVLRDLSGSSGVKVVTDRETFWGPPVFWCPFRKWLITHAVPFLAGSGKDLRIKGWFVLELDLQLLDVNQCSNDSTFSSFYANNVCNQATTECVHIPGQGFTDTSFRCDCKRFFHHGNFSGDAVRQQWRLHANKSASNYSRMECSPCPIQCPHSCTTDGRCLIEYDLDTLRALPLVIQTFCLTVCVLVAVIVFRTRRSRVIKSSVWILLELFLVGLSLLYATVFLMYSRPTYITCFVIPWLRELGFAITYGTLLVKIYRILCSFQSRKAHRVHVRDRDLLKYLAGIVAVAVGFMAAWTAATIDHSRRLGAAMSDLNCSIGAFDGHLVLEDGRVADGLLAFRTCAVGYWDAVCAAGEVAFLLVGLFYCYCVRSAPSDHWEIRCTTAAFCCELVFSLVHHVVRHLVWNSLHPDYVYLMYFARCHLTVTITAALILGPKLWHVHSPPKSALNQRSLVYSQVDTHLGDAMGQLSLTTNGDVEALDINLTDMSPEDIRAELKRLYTQLQIFKTKVMRRENPHISKRKGGRKQTHRRFSLQPFYQKHSHKQQQAASVQEEEASKVSDDSSNSAEGQEVPDQRPTGKESTATSSSSGSK